MPLQHHIFSCALYCLKEQTIFEAENLAAPTKKLGSTITNHQSPFLNMTMGDASQPAPKQEGRGVN